MKYRVKDLLKNLLALGLGILFSLIIAEGLTRIVLPIYPGAEKLDLEGKKLNINFIEPNTVYRQFSQEYDALTKITKQGYRVPEADKNPEIIFLGDSFTFGQGLADKETFPYIFCNKLQIPCANLGVPGASTILELDRLEEFIAREQWRPKQVFLFVLAMTQFLGEGNDLYDNLQQQAHLNRASVNNNTNLNNLENTENSSRSVFEALVDYRKTFLQYSNLFRVIKYQFGPLIKKYISPSVNKNKLHTALAITKKQLFRLDRLSKKFHFKYDIFLIYPVQDIMRGSHQETFMNLNAISPKTIKSTAHLFKQFPEQFYFPFDGHFNPLGSQKIADILVLEYGNQLSGEQQSKSTTRKQTE